MMEFSDIFFKPKVMKDIEILAIARYKYTTITSSTKVIRLLPQIKQLKTINENLEMRRLAKRFQAGGYCRLGVAYDPDSDILYVFYAYKFRTIL